MIDKLKWSGWVVATGLSLILLLQKSCRSNKLDIPLRTHDTVLVRGDSQLYIVRDTILKPYKIYYRDSISKVDTAGVIKDYFASRVYNDTIKARDVTAVIEDSISANKIAGHKVLIENSRNVHLTTLEPKPAHKIFIGGFIGYSLKDLLPVAGISFSLVTRKDVLYYYHYDALNRTHLIGTSWKIHFSKTR